MKKNLLSIIILALLVVNIVLTAVMMFSVVGTNKKVSGLVTNIATALSLELTVPGEEEKEQVSLADTEVYAITGGLTLPLAAETVTDSDGKTQSKQGYMVCSISFSINKKHKDYGKYGSAEEMAARETLLKDVINTVVSAHTSSELQADAGLEGLKAEILKAVQDLFQSEFIYRVSISDIKWG